MEFALAAFVIWLIWRSVRNSNRHKEEQRRRAICDAMSEVLTAEGKWKDGSWWHTERFDVASMVYSHNQGVDDQGWFTDYLAVRIGTSDWWFREQAITHYDAGVRTDDGPADYWFSARQMSHDPRPFLDARYVAAVRFFESHPGFTPQTMGEEEPLAASTLVWKPPVHADADRVVKNWEAFQARAKELQAYESQAMDASERCRDCGAEQDLLNPGRCSACGKILAKICSCGFHNLSVEGSCRSCGRRLRGADQTSKA